jgi:hypothetical protein
MKRFKRDIISLLISISLFSCSSLDKQRVDMPISTFLIMESNINSSDIISKIVYFFPSNGIINKINYKINDKDYNFTFLYLSRDGFQLLPCCEFGQVNYLSKDIEKSLKTFSEKRLDSLTDMNTIISNKLNKDISKIKSNKDMQIIRNDKIYRIVLVKGLEFCECKYRIPDGINIDEGFLLSVDKLEVINLKLMNEIAD